MGNHCLPCHLAAQPGQRGSLPLPRPLPVMGREKGAARWTFREPEAQGGGAFLPCSVQTEQVRGFPGRGMVESPALP